MQLNCFGVTPLSLTGENNAPKSAEGSDSILIDPESIVDGGQEEMEIDLEENAEQARSLGKKFGLYNPDRIFRGL